MKFKFILLLLLNSFFSTTQAQKTATIDYINQYKDIAIKEMKRTGIPASITLAQGIVESNSGKSNLAFKYNNHFGIKCKTDWKGETTYQDDDTKQECFRVYPNANASFIDHSNFIKLRPNYAPLFQLDPVDDSAWAIGLKKAGYATASDYAKILIKVIDDYELSQYNFPELNDENDTTNTEDSNIIENPTIITKTDKVAEIRLEKKDTSNILKNEIVNESPKSIITKKDTVLQSTITDTIKKMPSETTAPISKIKGITATNTNSSVNVIKMNSIGKDTTLIKKSIPDASAITKDTTTKVFVKKVTVANSDTSNSNNKTKIQSVNSVSSKKQTTNYPDNPFKINGTSVIWAKKDSSILNIAIENKIPLRKMYKYNDLEIPPFLINQNDTLPQDQLLFLGKKRRVGDTSFHAVAAGESLHEISQKRGIQLKRLKKYNPKIIDTPAIGTTLILVKPMEQRFKLSLNK